MSDAPVERVSLGSIFTTFLVLGATSFGGGVVAYLRERLVTDRRWLDDEEFMTALEIAQILPGLNSTNMSVIVGDRLRGAIGAAVAFAGMTIPGTIVVLVLGILYAQHGDHPSVVAALDGVAGAAVGLLTAVTFQLARKQITGTADVLIAIATLIAISVFRVSLLTTLVAIGSFAVWLHRPRPAAPPPAA